MESTCISRTVGQDLDAGALGLSSASLRVLLGSEELGSRGHELSVGGLGLLARLESRSGGSLLAPLSLESDWSDESLDLGGLGSALGVLLGGLQLSSDDKVSDIILLVEVEELSDLVGSLGSQSSVDDGVGEAGNVVVTLSDDNGGKYGEIVAGDATSNGLSLSLSLSAAGVAGVAVLEEESNSMSDEDTLLHAETLFVLTSGDSKDVALEFLAERVGGDLVGDSLLVNVLDLLLIIDFKGLLLAGGRVGDIDFHDGFSRVGVSVVFCKFDLRL